MAHARVLLVGGTGFIGSQVAGRLAAGNRHVLVPTRRYERARHLLPLPTVEVVEADVHDDAQLRRLVGGVDAVINLVGILHGRRGAPWGPEFDKAHVRLPARIAAACTDSGVRRLLHMSALGVQAGSERTAPSMYLRSKAAGEQAVREARALDWTIFRPSVVFGPGDSFLNLFARLQAWLPVMALARAGARFQPVFVGDVAEAIAAVAQGAGTPGQIYELGGPEVLSFRELLERTNEYAGRKRGFISLPFWLAKLQAALTWPLPNSVRPLTVDQVRLLQSDNVVSSGALEEGRTLAGLGVSPPRSIGAVVPSYLERFKAKGQYAHYRG